MDRIKEMTGGRKKLLEKKGENVWQWRFVKVLEYFKLKENKLLVALCFDFFSA